jgi:3'(2'), 5'-bisphosphate nucleotidase
MNLARLWDGLADELQREFCKFRSHLTGLDISVKSDNTLLTDADIAIENLIIHHIRAIDPNPVVVAEEDERSTIREEVLRRPGRIWVIDPIDGTAEFVKPEGREFCSVVCLLEDLVPTHAFVFAPELGHGATPIQVTGNVGNSSITVNGSAGDRRAGQWVSATRSNGTEPRSFEAELEQTGYGLKTRTTSQTLDMVRTAVNVETLTDPPLPQFQMFIRVNQKVWDGLAGLCLGTLAGLVCVDSHGRDRVPVSLDVLSQPEPVFSSTIVGDEELVSWLLERV